jgi:hypothetical protein
MSRYNEFVDAYLEAALWSTSDESDEYGGVALDQNYSIDDIAPETLARLKKDARLFLQMNESSIEADDSPAIRKHGRYALAGHDFWLTQNGHGSGFWDGDWPQFGELLTEASKRFGEVDLYIGDDGQIHGSFSKPLPEGLRERPRGFSREAARGGQADQHAADELVLYIDNTSDLSINGPRGQGRDVLLNALRKWRKGTYDPELAVKLFGYLVESGAKRYAREFASSEREWSTMFTPATRREAARQLEASFRSAAEAGEYDHVDVRPGAGSRGLRETREARSVSRIQVGDAVRLTGKFLRNTGQQRGPEGQKRWKVIGITGDWAIVDEPSDLSYFAPEEIAADPSLKYRRIALENLEIVKRGR